MQWRARSACVFILNSKVVRHERKENGLQPQRQIVKSNKVVASHAPPLTKGSVYAETLKTKVGALMPPPGATAGRKIDEKVGGVDS